MALRTAASLGDTPSLTGSTKFIASMYTQSSPAWCTEGPLLSAASVALWLWIRHSKPCARLWTERPWALGWNTSTAPPTRRGPDTPRGASTGWFGSQRVSFLVSPFFSVMLSCRQLATATHPAALCCDVTYKVNDSDWGLCRLALAVKQFRDGLPCSTLVTCALAMIPKDNEACLTAFLRASVDCHAEHGNDLAGSCFHLFVDKSAAFKAAMENVFGTGEHRVQFMVDLRHQVSAISAIRSPTPPSRPGIGCVRRSSGGELSFHSVPHCISSGFKPSRPVYERSRKANSPITLRPAFVQLRGGRMFPCWIRWWPGGRSNALQGSRQRQSVRRWKAPSEL